MMKKKNNYHPEHQQLVQRLEKMRQDFVANVSHELRTPLTVLHGYLEMLLDLNSEPDNKQHAILEQMYQQSLRMERLIEDLLLLSRLDNYIGEDRRSLVDVPYLLKSIVEDMRVLSRAQQHKIEVNADAELKIYGIENELNSAFTNLILNAINYTSAGGEIKIVWYKKGKRAFLEVRDTGIGIAAQHIPRLTERFYRVDKARSRSTGGTGLGLAIVNHVLFRHKAKLKIASIVGEGSTFTCIFPLP